MSGNAVRERLPVESGFWMVGRCGRLAGRRSFDFRSQLPIANWRYRRLKLALDRGARLP